MAAGSDSIEREFEEQIRKTVPSPANLFHNYFLLDPTILDDDNKLYGAKDYDSTNIIRDKFVQAVFYVGKGKGGNNRTEDHLRKAKNTDPQKAEESNPKLDQIKAIWQSKRGVIILYIFKNRTEHEAGKRESCMIKAIKAEGELKNQKEGKIIQWKEWNESRLVEIGKLMVNQAHSIFMNECPPEVFPGPETSDMSALMPTTDDIPYSENSIYPMFKKDGPKMHPRVYFAAGIHFNYMLFDASKLPARDDAAQLSEKDFKEAFLSVGTGDLNGNGHLKNAENAAKMVATKEVNKNFLAPAHDRGVVILQIFNNQSKDEAEHRHYCMLKTMSPESGLVKRNENIKSCPSLVERAYNILKIEYPPELKPFDFEIIRRF